ncbi:hypothetical protein TNCV_3926701 [Trichonephila clavipes]|nr:hypothetical protein TNCV_3926701 [Trichonephila clavipes]
MARRNYLNDFTRRMIRKLEERRTLTSVAERFRINSSVGSCAWKAFQAIGTVVIKFGNRPEYYMHAQDEMDIQALKAGTDTGKPNIKNIKIKHFQPTGGNQKEIIARSATAVKHLFTSWSPIPTHGSGPRLLTQQTLKNNDTVKAANPPVRCRKYHYVLGSIQMLFIVTLSSNSTIEPENLESNSSLEVNGHGMPPVCR